MRPPARRALLGLATLVAASPAHAQTTVSQPSIAAPKWILSVGIQETLASRALLSAASDQGDLISRPGASVTHNWLGSRFRLGASARGSALLYKTLTNLNHFNYVGGVAGAYQASPQTSLTFADTITSAYTYDQQLLTEEGAILPLVLSRTNRAAMALTHQFSSRTAGAVDVSDDLIKFDSSSLSGGSRFGIQAQVTRAVSGSQRLGVAYAFKRDSNRGRITLLNSAVASWTVTISPRVDFNSSLGPALLNDDLHSENKVVVVGSAALATHFQRTTLATRYHRTVTPAYGLGGDRTVDAVAFDLNRTLTQKLSFTAIVDFALSRDPFDPSVRFISQNHSADFLWALTPKLNVVAGYGFRSRDPKSSATISSNSVNLSLAYGQHW